jgi:hypothetical protein
MESFSDCVCSIIVEDWPFLLLNCSCVTFQPVTYLYELFMEVAVRRSMLSVHFGDCNQYHLAKLMFCTIAKLYTFCYRVLFSSSSKL